MQISGTLIIDNKVTDLSLILTNDLIINKYGNFTIGNKNDVYISQMNIVITGNFYVIGYI